MQRILADVCLASAVFLHFVWSLGCVSSFHEATQYSVSATGVEDTRLVGLEIQWPVFQSAWQQVGSDDEALAAGQSSARCRPDSAPLR